MWNQVVIARIHLQFVKKLLSVSASMGLDCASPYPAPGLIIPRRACFECIFNCSPFHPNHNNPFWPLDSRGRHRRGISSNVRKCSYFVIRYPHRWWSAVSLDWSDPPSPGNLDFNQRDLIKTISFSPSDKFIVSNSCLSLIEISIGERRLYATINCDIEWSAAHWRIILKKLV